MILYEYKCSECNQVTEKYFNMSDFPNAIGCPVCNGKAYKIISIPGSNLASESPDWIKSITEVVQKDGGQHCQEFLKNPTRDNYKNWMNKEGVRHLEPGERTRPKPSPPEHIITEKLLKKRMERRRIEI